MRNALTERGAGGLRMRLGAVVLAAFIVLVALTVAQAVNPPAAEAAHPPQAATPQDSLSALPDGQGERHSLYRPRNIWVLPFVAILLAIAIFPVLSSTKAWWHRNWNKLMFAMLVALATCIYYLMRPHGFLHADPGIASLLSVFNHAILQEYIPFIVLLFSLYTISGGIHLGGDLAARPITNTAFLAIGAVLASFIGTTGASMLLIRPLLKTNRERKHVTHTVIFFIFLVSNIGGCLLPIGDPPLFLGYLRGVDFLWTFNLAAEWAFAITVLLGVYFIWDSFAYRTEKVRDIRLDEKMVTPLKLRGKWNFLWLLGVVLSVALLVPDTKPFGGDWICPPFLREVVQLMLVAFAWISTSPAIRKANKFDFEAIGEVACLFIGIFIAMQVPIEILNAVGPSLAEKGVNQPWHFFWLTGGLSGFLDNAPTYVVYFETARAMPIAEGVAVVPLGSNGQIAAPLLTAISLGAVFMGAMTYIGNGPNFMVRSIAEQSGVKMPSFFGYMLYSIAVLVPLFVIVTFVFLM